MLHLKDLGVAQVLCLEHIGGGLEVLHLKDLDCTKIVQNRPISTRCNGLSHLLDLCANDARSCWREDSGKSCGEKRDGRIPEKSPLRQSRNLRESTREARPGRASLTYARHEGRTR